MDEKRTISTDDGFGKRVSVPGAVIGSPTSNPERIDEPSPRKSEPSGEGAGLGGYKFISPADLAGDSSRTDAGSDLGGTTRKRRGRPPGSGAKQPQESEEKVQRSLANLDSLIFLGHLTFAKMLSVPEIELDEIESKRLADAVQNVAKYYPILIDPKKIAIAELVFAAGSIYGPRAMAIMNRPKPPKPVRSVTQTAPAPAQNTGPIQNGLPPDYMPDVGFFNGVVPQDRIFE